MHDLALPLNRIPIESNTPEQRANFMQDLSPLAVKALLDGNIGLELLDVREPQEFQHVHIEGSTLIPMNQVPSRLNEIDKEKKTVVICHHGMRSMQVAQFLEQKGYGKIINLKGGIDAWALTVDTTMKRY